MTYPDPEYICVHLTNAIDKTELFNSMSITSNSITLDEKLLTTYRYSKSTFFLGYCVKYVYKKLFSLFANL